MTKTATQTISAEDALRMLEESFEYYTPEVPAAEAEQASENCDYTPYAEAA